MTFKKINLLKLLCFISVFYLESCTQKIEEKKEEYKPPVVEEIKVVPLPDVPKNIPIQEKVNKTMSKYFKGTINYENVEDKNNIKNRIFNIDLEKYPNEVRLLVNVFDKNGNKVANLAPPYNKDLSFWKSLKDSCNKFNKIENFNVIEKREKELLPLSVSYVLDFSGSMAFQNNIKSLVDAYSKSKKNIRNIDYYSTVQFSTVPFNTIPLSQNINEFDNLLDFNLIAGATAFYDGSILGINNISKQNTQKIAILMTDGVNNASFSSKYDVIMKARQNNIKIFVIGYIGDGTFAPAKDLKDIAEQTGGHYYGVSNGADFTDIFDEIYQSLQVYYEITYKPVDCGANKHIVELETINGQKTYIERKPYFVTPPKDTTEIRVLIANFKYNKFDVDTVYNESLKRFAEYINKNPHKFIEVHGHTDTKGSAKYNKRLSFNRANEIKSELIKKYKIRKNAFKKVIGFGKEKPLRNPDDTDWESYDNRRVEVIIVN